MSHNHPAQMDPRKRALQMMSGSSIAAALSRDAKAPKAGGASGGVNHAAVNRQNLKAAQLKNQLRRAEETLAASEEPFKMQRFKQVDSVVRQRTEAAAVPRDQTHQFTKKGEGKGVVAKLGGLTIKSGSLTSPHSLAHTAQCWRSGEVGC
jgi:hypothetical protein